MNNINRSEIREIVTHPGPAHRDEFIACSLLLGVYPALPVYRREPTEEDLLDPAIIVVDVGGQFDLHLRNFDHHQLPRDAEPTCAITQVCKWLNIDLPTARALWSWLEAAEILDSKGPVALAKKYGIRGDDLHKMISTIESTVVDLFSTCSAALPGDLLHRLMLQVGKTNLDYLELVQERMALLEKNVKFYTLPAPNGGKVRVVDTTFLPGTDKPALGVEVFLKQRTSAETDVVVSNDDRGTGLTLFRRQAAEGVVDFSLLEGNSEVLFAHKGGFIAKTHSQDVDWRILVEKAALPS
jgi:hypothetical protein